MIYGQNFPPEYILCTFTRRRCAAYNESMDALTLLLLYLVTQNPDFQCKLAPFADKLKESEDMLKFYNAESEYIAEAGEFEAYAGGDSDCAESVSFRLL